MRNPFRRIARQNSQPAPATPVAAMIVQPPQPVEMLALDMAPNDPLLAYLLSARGPVEIEKLKMNSAALRGLREAGARLVAPLVGQGELIGLLNLGPRRSEQDYTSDDRKFLDDLATQAAPAVRVAQLVRQQQIEIRERERIEQELRVARIIQQTLLPKALPDLPGWRITAYWQPARAIGGDFYDFMLFEDGRLGIFIADVTGKGVPAALVMASVRSTLRATAERLIAPGAVLQRANDLICPDIPENMFVTCLYILLDPASGALRFANAGHNLPSLRTSADCLELRATGMPLGLLPGMGYEEKEALLAPGNSLLVYSDGLTEAHNPQGEMFGFPRLRDLLSNRPTEVDTIAYLNEHLTTFTGPGWEQEDDVTFVVVERSPADLLSAADAAASNSSTASPVQVLADFNIPSAPDNERDAVAQVAAAVAAVGLSDARRQRLETAVAEATMNAMEHGNQYRADRPVAVRVLTDGNELIVRITDHGGGQEIPDAEEPDLEAKLNGLQSPRGWGLFLIRSMVDEMRVHHDATHHIIELVLKLEGENNASPTL